MRQASVKWQGPSRKIILSVNYTTGGSNATSNRCIASSNKCIATRNKKLLGAPGLTRSKKLVIARAGSREVEVGHRPWRSAGAAELVMLLCYY